MRFASTHWLVHGHRRSGVRLSLCMPPPGEENSLFLRISFLPGKAQRAATGAVFAPSCPGVAGEVGWRFIPLPTPACAGSWMEDRGSRMSGSLILPLPEVYLLTLRASRRVRRPGQCLLVGTDPFDDPFLKSLNP